MVAITKKHTFKSGSRRGLLTTLTPHQFKGGAYKLFSPVGEVGRDGNSHLNGSGNSKSVQILEEVAADVLDRWGVHISRPLMPKRTTGFVVLTVPDGATSSQACEQVGRTATWA